MKRFYLLIMLIPLLAAYSCKNEAGNKFPRAEMGDRAMFDSVYRDVAKVATNELHGIVVVKDKKVIYENWYHNYTPDHLHVMWSASKTFTATAVGFAIQDGLMTISDKVIDYFTSEELPAEPSEYLKKMTVYDLMIMSSGFKDDHLGRSDSGEDFNWAKATLASEIIFEPGTRFAYNSMNTYLLSVIVSRVTGKRLDDYLNEKLFTPLGITEYTWTPSPQNYSAGGWGLYITTEDFAKMGVFMMDKGVWNGKRLLDENWFEEGMSAQIMQYAGQDLSEEEIAVLKQDEWNHGYGYQMWISSDGAPRLDGAGGQICVIYPEKNLVIAVHCHTNDTMGLLKSIRTRIASQF